MQITSGELEAFRLAVRSFCAEVSYIECNTTKNRFKNVIPKVLFENKNFEDFEFDLISILKVINRNQLFDNKTFHFNVIKGVCFFSTH